MPRRGGPISPSSILAPALLAGLLASPALAFDLQGHRGTRGLAPENTLPAFAAALAIGVTTLELDLGLTADGVPLVSHDARLNPDLARDATGVWLAGPGPFLRTRTVDELKAYDVGRARPGSRIAERFPDQRPVDGTCLPTLEDVFDLVRRAGNEAVRFNVETKIRPTAPESPAATAAPEEFAAALVDTLRREGMAARSTIQSFDWRTLRAARRLAPEIATVCLTAEQDWLNNVRPPDGTPGAWTDGLDIAQHGGSVPRLVKAAGCAVWSPFHRDLTPARLAKARQLGLDVVVWTVNGAGRMAALIEMGVNGIISDRPDILRGVMADRGMALPAATPVSVPQGAACPR